MSARFETEFRRVTALYAEGDAIDCLVVREMRGGLLVDVGLVEPLHAFLPSSQIDVVRPLDRAAYVGTSIRCVILRIDLSRRNIVVSRRRLLESSHTPNVSGQ